MGDMALHFVGFRGDEYLRAIKLFGRPDFIHRYHDVRMVKEIAEGDVVVFANGEESKEPRHPSFNDSEWVLRFNAQK